jgi:hypothetical protein
MKRQPKNPEVLACQLVLHGMEEEARLVLKRASSSLIMGDPKPPVNDTISRLGDRR